MDLFDSAVLGYGLFEGDRDSNVKMLDNRMLITRRPHRCVICQQDIPAGARVRAQTEVSYDERKVMTFYVCQLCCEAIATRFDDHGQAIEQRTGIGMGFGEARLANR